MQALILTRKFNLKVSNIFHGKKKTTYTFACPAIKCIGFPNYEYQILVVFWTRNDHFLFFTEYEGNFVRVRVCEENDFT